MRPDKNARQKVADNRRYPELHCDQTTEKSQAQTCSHSRYERQIVLNLCHLKKRVGAGGKTWKVPCSSEYITPGCDKLNNPLILQRLENDFGLNRYL